jgi:hypothetical protein
LTQVSKQIDFGTLLRSSIPYVSAHLGTEETTESMNLREWPQDELRDFRDRVSNVMNTARSATANVVATLTSFIMALLGAAVTLSTEKFHLTNTGLAILVAIGACGLAALFMIFFQMVEAVRATRWHQKLSARYRDAVNGTLSHDELYHQSDGAHITVSIYWKIVFPCCVLALGLVSALITFATGMSVVSKTLN